MVDENEDPHKRQSGLDHAKDTSGEEAGASAGDTDTSEDGGAVVVNGIDSGSCGSVSEIKIQMVFG